MADDEAASTDAWPMAEYVAMRAEILQCSQQMATLFNVLVAAVGVVLGVALRPNGNLPEALVVMLVFPAVSYLTAVRYVYLYTGAVRIGTFINTELSAAASGALRWESWLSSSKDSVRASRRMWILRQGLADWVAFVGIAVVGLVGSGYAIFWGQWTNRALLYIAWSFSVALTGLTAWTLTAKQGLRARFRMGETTSASPPPAEPGT